MSSRDINHDNIDFYLNEFSKEFKRLTKRKGKIEIILVGGASALINYSFRNSTYDIDAIMFEKSVSKEALNRIADKYNLPNDWLNYDFEKSSSYSDKLILHSKYYKTFANCVDVRTVAGPYLIAMKLKSGRSYKHDLSDIVGIVLSEKKMNNNITYEEVVSCFEEMYGNINIVDERLLRDLKRQTELDVNQLQEKYDELCLLENDNRRLLLEFNELYNIRPDKDKVNETIESFKQAKLRKES